MIEVTYRFQCDGCRKWAKKHVEQNAVYESAHATVFDFVPDGWVVTEGDHFCGGCASAASPLREPDA